MKEQPKQQFRLDSQSLFSFSKEGNNGFFETTSNGCSAGCQTDPTTWTATTMTTGHCRAAQQKN